MHAREIIGTHPHVQGNTNDALIQCIVECYDCAQTCTSCADACLGEDMVAELVQCIRCNLDCADLCLATGAVATRRSGSNEAVIRASLEACAVACRLCADECTLHASQHQHCRICADACNTCLSACETAIRTLAH
jgi:hypothetical protein